MFPIKNDSSNCEIIPYALSSFVSGKRTSLSVSEVRDRAKRFDELSDDLWWFGELIFRLEYAPQAVPASIPERVQKFLESSPRDT
jgi:hypothetical protein